MKIGLDANEANVTNRVGSNQFAYQVLCQLYKQDKKNSYLIFLKDKPVKDLPPVTDRWQYRLLRPGFFWTQWRLPLSLYLDRPRPDIFFTLGHYAPRFSPLPTIISIMDLAYLKFPQTYLKKDLQKLKNWTKYSAKKASHIFTISQHSKKDIIKHYGVSQNKITVIYPAVNQPKGSSKITDKQIKGDYLLYLGTLQPRKNLVNLVKAFASLTPKNPQLKLVIAGKKGWLYQSLFTLVKQLKLEKKVIFTGFVPPHSIHQLIKKAQALILPSLYEGFGIPVLQAMSFSTLILVSQNSSLPEIVADTGIYIKPPFGSQEIEQGIIEVLALTQKQKKHLVNQAQQRAKQFTWRKTGQKILEVINELTF